jgi:enamine deaminase RidA (YjgF/YER057c/UK114 family)
MRCRVGAPGRPGRRNAVAGDEKIHDEKMRVDPCGRRVLAAGAMSNDIRIDVVERHGRRCASSGARWEPVMGYARAVRSGNTIAVTGTVGIDADGTYAPSVADQTRRALAIIQAALEALGGRLEHVLRTRMFVTDVSEWEAIAAVHGQVFGYIRPATTLVEVTRLIDAGAKIEIEADAIVP